MLPLGTTHRAEEDRIGLFTSFQSVRGEGTSGRIDGSSTDEELVEFDRKAVRSSGGFENATRFRHHFGTHSVAGKDCNSMRCHAGGLSA